MLTPFKKDLRFNKLSRRKIIYEKIKNNVVKIELKYIDGSLMFSLSKKHSNENIEKFSVGAMDIVVDKKLSNTSSNSNGKDLRMLKIVR